ncbi:MAG: V-type ATP synthase subunit F [candidate division WOR-3 bacterium]
MKIKVIGDEFACIGFALLGVSTVSVEDKESVEKEFEKALKEDDLGIILITENEAELIRDKITKQKTKGQLPLVVEIPGRSGWKERGKALELFKKVLMIKI